MNSSEGIRPWVLLVDDDDSIRELLAGAIRLWGFDCLEAATVEAARGFVRDGKVFDVIVCDGILSDGSGSEFIHWLRSQKIQTPVVFISGSVQSPNFNGHGVDFLPKPFRLAEFHELLEHRAKRH